MNAEGLTEVTFDLVSRGRPVFGRYDNGSQKLAFGDVQSTLLPLTAGVRQVSVVPANNADSISTGANLTATYTSDGSSALTELALGTADGSGFVLSNASTGAVVDCIVSIAANVVTVNPNSALDGDTIYVLNIIDGAVKQAVDANGNPSATGVQRPIEGTKVSFKTA